MHTYKLAEPEIVIKLSNLAVITLHHAYWLYS